MIISAFLRAARDCSLTLVLALAPFSVASAAGQTAVTPGPTAAKVSSAGKLRVGVAVAAPALLQDPASGKYVGPAVTLAEAVASKLGVSVEYVDSSWEAIVAGLQSGAYEIAIAPLYATPKRLEVIDIVPYFQDGICYITRKGNPKTLDIKVPADLDRAGLTVATVAGSAPELEIRKKFSHASLKSVSVPAGGTLATEEVVSGRADVTTADASQIRVVLARNPTLQSVPDPNVCIKTPDMALSVGLGVRKEDPAFTSLIKGVVAAIQPQIDAEILKYAGPEFAGSQ